VLSSSPVRGNRLAIPAAALPSYALGHGNHCCMLMWVANLTHVRTMLGWLRSRASMASASALAGSAGALSAGSPLGPVLLKAGGVANTLTATSLDPLHQPAHIEQGSRHSYESCASIPSTGPKGVAFSGPAGCYICCPQWTPSTEQEH
jgi:hypothetical protein